MAQTIASLQAVIGADTSSFQRGLKSAESSLHSFGSTATNVAGTVGKTLVGAFALATGAMAALGGASIKAAADFEQSMSGIKAVSGATAAEMKMISDLALKLGADT